MEANIDELKIIKTAKFPQVLPMFKAHGEMWSNTSLSVFSVKNATQLPTALPEIKKQRRKKCIKEHTNCETSENLLVGNITLNCSRPHSCRGGNLKMCHTVF